MQEYLKAEKRMIDKGFQLTSNGVLRRIYKDLSYLLTFIFVFGCTQLPVQVGVETMEATEGSAEEAGQVSDGNEIKQSETEERNTNPFDLDLSEDERKQSELDSALRRLVKDLEQAMQEANEGISANTDGTYAVSYTHLTLPTICSV